MIEGWWVLPALALWAGLLLLPWRPWSTAESLEAADPEAGDPGKVTVLIPARNEAGVIRSTLEGLRHQGPDLKIVLIDDQSDDETVPIARSLGLPNLHVITGQPLPPDWSGKLWALEQGRACVDTALTLLLDADIELAPGLVQTLCGKMENESLDMVSLMAELRMAGFWERLLMPAFIFFFKLLYPFRLSNSPSRRVAAAAGGCLLIRTRLIEAMGGFTAIKGALIDDCALATEVKSRGGKTWTGLTHSARSLRSYTRLATIWDMVARTAFTQLRYSAALLLLCSTLMIIAFFIPLLGLSAPSDQAFLWSVSALAIMMLSYVPTLRYYGLSSAWSLALPAVGLLYLMMTWTSAVRYMAGERSQWKGRRYRSDPHKRADS
jgi:hopene-associated glycosyltransferase HpnB